MDSVKVVLRNYQTKETIDYNIIPRDNQLARDWTTALEQDVLQKSLHLEKNFCFHGFPHTQRTLEYLCNELNRHIYTINTSGIGYIILLKIGMHLMLLGLTKDTQLEIHRL